MNGPFCLLIRDRGRIFCKKAPIFFGLSSRPPVWYNVLPLGLTYEIDCENAAFRLLEPATV